MQRFSAAARLTAAARVLPWGVTSKRSNFNYLIVYVTALHSSALAVMGTLWPNDGFAREAQYLWFAAAAGIFGSSIHLAASVGQHAAAGTLDQRWVPWYALRPLMGGGLAVAVGLLLQAGLVTGTAALNPCGVAALCCLSGLFSPRALEKLREMFEYLLPVRESAKQGPNV